MNLTNLNSPKASVKLVFKDSKKCSSTISFKSAPMASSNWSKMEPSGGPSSFKASWKTGSRFSSITAAKINVLFVYIYHDSALLFVYNFLFTTFVYFNINDSHNWSMIRLHQFGSTIPFNCAWKNKIWFHKKKIFFQLFVYILWNIHVPGDQLGIGSFDSCLLRHNTRSVQAGTRHFSEVS